MDSSGIYRPEKVLPQRGQAFAPPVNRRSAQIAGSADEVVGGAIIEIMAPIAAPPKALDLQE
jgi:hypothetical protein